MIDNLKNKICKSNLTFYFIFARNFDFHFKGRVEIEKKVLKIFGCKRDVVMEEW
jgi:hypothetical protein